MQNILILNMAVRKVTARLWKVKEIQFQDLKPIGYCIIKYFVSYYFIGLQLDIKNV